MPDSKSAERRKVVLAYSGGLDTSVTIRWLIEQGYDGSYNGDAYGSVMYQNENLSVRVSDDFMHAALEDREWWTRRVRDGSPCERKDARTLLRKIAEGTHICGDPGMQFDSTIHKWHTCKGTGRQNSTNPCSEYLFLDNTACNLASLNLMKFKTAEGAFDVDRLHVCHQTVRHGPLRRGS